MIVVKNKWTYLWLALVVIAIIKFIVLDLNSSNIIQDIFVSILIALLGIYMFVKLNSRSNWMNPDHPTK